MKAIINVSGDKGGVGKSITSMGVIHYFVSRGEKVLLVESDSTNYDVGLAYSKDGNVTCHTCNLDNTDGWMDLIDLVEANPDKVVVINSPARSGNGVKQSGDLLAAALPELNRELITLWVLDNKKDVVASLMAYVEAMPQSEIVAVRNLHHGTEDTFDAYNDSKTRKQVEANGGKTINFPAVALRVTQLLQVNRQTIQKVGFDPATPISVRVEAQKWVRNFSEQFDGIFAEVTA